MTAIRLGLLLVLPCLLLALSATSAHAGSIIIGDWTNHGDVDGDEVLPAVTVNDADHAGYFTFCISIHDASSNQAADISGVYIDFGLSNADNPYSEDVPPPGPPAPHSPNDISFESGGDLATHLGVNGQAISGVTNTPTDTGDFDVIVGYKPKAITLQTDGNELKFSLLIRGNLTLDDMTRVGIRWQSIGTQGGSDMQIGVPGGNPNPEPATIGLFGLAIGGLAVARRRRRAL